MPPQGPSERRRQLPGCRERQASSLQTSLLCLARRPRQRPQAGWPPACDGETLSNGSRKTDASPVARPTGGAPRPGPSGQCGCAQTGRTALCNLLLPAPRPSRAVVRPQAPRCRDYNALCRAGNVAWRSKREKQKPRWESLRPKSSVRARSSGAVVQRIPLLNDVVETSCPLERTAPAKPWIEEYRRFHVAPNHGSYGPKPHGASPR